METTKIKPSRLWYIVSAILFILIVIGELMQVGSIVSRLETRKYMIVPGTFHLELAKPSSYTIYYEYQTTIKGVNSEVYPSKEFLASLNCTLSNLATGEEIKLLKPTRTTIYSEEKQKATSIYEFKITKGGTYELDAQYIVGYSYLDKVFTVQQSIGQFDLLKMLIFVIAANIVFALAIILSAKVHSKRKIAIKKLQELSNNS